MMNQHNSVWSSCLISAVFLAQPSCHALANTPVTITVKQGAKQKFQGFGASQIRESGIDYSKLTPSQKKLLNKLVCTKTKFKIVRLWFDPTKYAPQPGKRDTGDFVKSFIKSGFISDALANGCTTLLLAPDKIPAYMGASEHGYIYDAEIKNYAALLANFIRQIKQETGIKINVTGVLNEPNDKPLKLSDAQWPLMIKTLRRELDHRGLKHVKIIAPELANADAIAVRVIQAIKNDPEAWRDLAGISTHSYNMAATTQISDLIAETDKEYWQTEAGANGREDPGDAVNAASAASRFLNDMNHRVTHWLWFIGYAPADPKDDATRLIRYSRTPFHYDIFQKYYYFLQLSQTFDIKAQFRQSISSLERNRTMTWTYGKKPQITVASAKNPDGSWGIAVSNYTSNKFVNSNASEWMKTQEGFGAESFRVTVFIEELAKTRDIKMQMYRSNSNINNIYMGSLVMHKGKVTIPKVDSLDLITLRSSVIQRERNK